MGEIELGIGFASLVPASSLMYKRTWKLSPNRDVFTALTEATNIAVTKFHLAISNIESPIAGSDKPVKLGEARTALYETYARSFVKSIVKTARNRVYDDFTKATGKFVPKSVYEKLGDPLADAFGKWLLQ